MNTQPPRACQWARWFHLPLLALGLVLFCTPDLSRAATEVPAPEKPQANNTMTDTETEPQLMEFNWGEAVWVVIIFVILLAVLYPTAWKNVLAGLKKRQERIEKEIADAEATRQRAEETLRKYNQQLTDAEERVRQMIASAGVEGEKIATQIRARAQQEAEDTRERALRDIEQARKQAVSDVYQEAATLATSVAEKILRRNLNADDQRHLVDESLNQLSQSKMN